jgi:hypothetical protein
MVAITAAVDSGSFTGLALRIDGQMVATGTVSPLHYSFDSTAHPDGPVTVEAVVTDPLGGQTSCVAQLVVDNQSFADFVPRTLNVKSKSPGAPVLAVIEGVDAGSLLPTEAHAITLRVPGGAPMPAETSWPGDDLVADRDLDGIPDLTVRFSRAALTAAILSGIANGQINPSGSEGFVTVALYAEGREIGATEVRLVQAN